MHDISGEHVRRWPAVCLALALLAALFALAPGTAYAGWSRPPDNLGNLPQFASGPFTAIDGRGTSYAAWTTYSGDFAGGPSTLRVRTRPAGGTWQRTQVPVRSDQSIVVFDVVATRGAVTVVWDETTGGDHYHPFYNAILYTSTRSRAGTWTTTQLSQPGAVGADAAVNAGGALVVAWQTGDAVSASVHARIRSSAGTWGPDELVSDEMGGKVEAGLDSAGFATVAAFHTDASGGCTNGCEVLTSRSVRGGQWQPVPTVTGSAPAVGVIDDFSLAVGPAGEGALGWTTSYPYQQEIAVRSGDNNVWTDPIQLGDYSSTPSPAVAPDGGFTAVWSVPGATYSSDLHSGQPLWGPWSTPQQISSWATHALWSAPDGTLLAVMRSDRLVRSPAGGWTPLPKPPRVGPFGASSTLGDGGRILTAWATSASSGKPASIGATAYDPDRPAFTRLKTPRTGKVGHRLTFKAKVDSWLPATVRWRFGGGARATGLTVHHTYRTTGKHRVVITVKDTSGVTITAHRAVTIRRHS
jgi:PKD domain